MQRQLLQIADKIPDDIMLTLLKCFAKILSREPEPAPRPAPFIRAFARIRDDGTFAAEDEDFVRDYDSGNEVETFDTKANLKTEENIVAVSENDGQKLASIEEVAENAENEPTNGEIIQNGDEPQELSENSENIDEGIELEMPKLLADDATIDAIVEQEAGNVDSTEAFDEIAENSEENVEKSEEIPQEIIEEEPVPVEEEPVIEEEPIPEEPPKVSLDDIQREIEEMQFFLKKKGLDGEKKKKREEQPEEVVVETDPKNIEDAYQVDVCIKLNKNREHKEHKHHHKKHHHSKYIKSENYKEEIIDAGPIFDPTVPNTQEDFLKVKSIQEKQHKKPKKGTQAYDVSWQNVLETQKKHYK